MAESKVPAGYELPTGVYDKLTFALADQPGESTTPLFMVIKCSPGSQEILAEKCYLGYGKEIVDALREVHGG